jgi:hypothetical protein
MGSRLCFAGSRGDGEWADLDRAVVVGAGCVDGGGGVQHEPAGLEGREPCAALGGCGVAEMLVGQGGCQPCGSQRGEIRSDAAILREVGQRAALADGAEALGVFPGYLDVAGIEREECIGAGVIASPEEGLHPWVRSGAPGPLEVRRGRERSALDEEHGHGGEDDHGGGERAKQAMQREAAALCGVTTKLPEDRAERERQQQIQRTENAHGLQARNEWRTEVLLRA